MSGQTLCPHAAESSSQERQQQHHLLTAVSSEVYKVIRE